MSRSRRAPYATEGYGGANRKAQKKLANKSVRNVDDVANGMAYKKEFNSWNICDFRFKLEPTKKNCSK